MQGGSRNEFCKCEFMCARGRMRVPVQNVFKSPTFEVYEDSPVKI